MKGIRRIMHATDFSPASAAAFGKAVALAAANGAELELVHVHHVSPKIPADLAAAGWADADERISRLAARARKQGASRVRTLLLDGVPHERIASAARSRRADLVVIGTHGRTGLAKLFLGSVASRVVSSAACPVLTVRGR